MSTSGRARISSWTGWAALLAAATALLACSACSEASDDSGAPVPATYRVTLEGRNYVLQLGDEQRRVGFSATRIVQAPSSEIAAEMAMELVERDEIWVGRLVNQESDRPQLRAARVEEIEASEAGSGPAEGLYDYDFYDDFRVEDVEDVGDFL